jgi:hypothetical protein
MEIMLDELSLLSMLKYYSCTTEEVINRGKKMKPWQLKVTAKVKVILEYENNYKNFKTKKCMYKFCTHFPSF